MSKLLKLKQWLTVPDAAKYLTGACEEIVTEADVLRFALDGQLTLSVFFVNKAIGRLARCDTSTQPMTLMSEGEVVVLEDVMSLPMIFHERQLIEYLFKKKMGLEPDSPTTHRRNLETGIQCLEALRSNAAINQDQLNIGLHKVSRYLADMDKVCVAGLDGKLFELLELDNEEWIPGIGFVSEGIVRWKEFKSAEEFPQGSSFVVRIAAIHEFLERALEPEKSVEKPLGGRERETLLTIIGVLAKEAKIDITEPYKAGGVIAKIAEFEGINLAARTTGDHLKLIPDILENRTKP